MLNSIVIMGRLTKDPELRYTNTQVPVTSFTVAVERDFNGGGEKITDFIDCVAWRNTAEFVSKYFSKGSMATVKGSLHSRKWTDKNNNSRINWEVSVESIYFGEVRKNNAIDPVNVEGPSMGETDDGGELPF